MDDITTKCERIKLLVMDVDGTLTDGTVLYSKNGEELKRFSIIDGMGVELLRRAGIEAAIITSENSAIVTARAAKLKIKKIILGSRDKKRALTDLSEKMNLDLENIAYIGDDVNDYYALQTAGVGACPHNSSKEVKYVCDYICQSKGGEGAVREFAELILLSQNKSVILPENWE